MTMTSEAAQGNTEPVLHWRPFTLPIIAAKIRDARETPLDMAGLRLETISEQSALEYSEQ